MKLDVAADRQMLQELLVHACDIGSAGFGWDEAQRWSRLVTIEFQTQVSRERAVDLPVSSFMDLGDGPDVAEKMCTNQSNFIGYVCKPYMELFVPHGE